MELKRMEQKKWKNKNFLAALGNSLNGIKYTLKSEKNIKIQLIFAIIAIALGIFFELNYIEFAILVITISFVLFAELVNTAIETMFDLYSEEYNEKIKIGKDIASGAVLVTAINSLVIACILFLPKILN
jgi:diacylglycerol kinase (ATP)